MVDLLESTLVNHPRNHLGVSREKSTALLGGRCVCAMLEVLCASYSFSNLATFVITSTAASTSSFLSTWG